MSVSYDRTVRLDADFDTAVTAVRKAERGPDHRLPDAGRHRRAGPNHRCALRRGPGTLVDMAMNNGFTADKAMALSLFVAMIHGLAVAEHARGQGIAATLLKRTWQVHHQFGYLLLYGSYETDRDLAAFSTRCGYTVHAPGEIFPLDRIALPFRLGTGDDQCVFTRWRPAAHEGPKQPGRRRQR